MKNLKLILLMVFVMNVFSSSVFARSTDLPDKPQKHVHKSSVKKAENALVYNASLDDGNAGRVKCCVKFKFPKLKFKRPKKDCKKGLGICLSGSIEVCVICAYNGTPDCSKCFSGKMAETDDIDVSGSYDSERSIFSLALPASLLKTKGLYDADDDLSTFYIDEEITLINAATKEVFLVLPAGAYHVNNDGINLDIPIAVKQSTMATSVKADGKIAISQNPNKGVFSIKLENINSGVAKVYDADGKIVFEQAFKNNQSELNVNIQKRDNGIYYIVVMSDDNRNFTERIIKK